MTAHLKSAAWLVLRIGRALVLSAMVGMAVGSVGPSAFGWHPTVVTSGSMSPAIHVGDVVVTSPVPVSEVPWLRPGSVVLAADPNHPGSPVLHRLVRHNLDGTLTTRGDANPGPDSTPVRPDRVLGVGRFRIPLVGVPVLRARQGDPLPAIAVVVFTATLVVARPRRRRPVPAG